MASTTVEFLLCQSLLERCLRLIIQAIHIGLLRLLWKPRIPTEQLAPGLLGPGSVTFPKEVNIVGHILLLLLG